jgi:glycopeptide antibiotics resistance protein
MSSHCHLISEIRTPWNHARFWKAAAICPAMPFLFVLLRLAKRRHEKHWIMTFGFAPVLSIEGWILKNMVAA